MKDYPTLSVHRAKPIWYTQQIILGVFGIALSAEVQQKNNGAEVLAYGRQT